MSNILIIEDESELADTLAYNLRMDGHTTQVAFDGTDGLRKAKADPRPDLILLDLMLPDMSGEEICATLRADPDTKGTYVIMVTARTEEQDRIAGFEVGADDYVPKPFSVKELVLRVKAAARRTQSTTVEVPGAPDELKFDNLTIDSAHQ